MISASQFPDSFRTDIYWLSTRGSLLGMLPCLGSGKRSFFSISLPPKIPSKCLENKSEILEKEYEGGMYVYFDDGTGGICCIRLKDII